MSNLTEPNKQSAKGRKAMLIIGIILLNISIFMAAFVFSFNMIINPIEKRDTQVQNLTDENTKLKADSQLLQDQLDVVQSELDTYKKKYGSSNSSTSSPSSTSKPNSSGKNNSDSQSGSSSEGRSKSGTSNEQSEKNLNMDND